MKKNAAATEAALKEANDLIARLVNALDAVERASDIHFARGVAGEAMRHANRVRTRNVDGYLTVPTR